MSCADGDSRDHFGLHGLRLDQLFLRQRLHVAPDLRDGDPLRAEVFAIWADDGLLFLQLQTVPKVAGIEQLHASVGLRYGVSRATTTRGGWKCSHSDEPPWRSLLPVRPAGSARNRPAQ